MQVSQRHLSQYHNLLIAVLEYKYNTSVFRRRICASIFEFYAALQYSFDPNGLIPFVFIVAYSMQSFRETTEKLKHLLRQMGTESLQWNN
jgi:hypothetical protein